MLVIAGCAGQGATASSLDLAAQRDVATVDQPRVTISPADGTAGVSPTEEVTATVMDGQLTQVALTTAEGVPIAGSLSPDGERWASSQPLKPNTSYVLKAASRAVSGQENHTTTRFSTLAPGQQVGGKITPDASAPVAPDAVVSVLFDKPIVDRSVVERSLRVSANPATNGTAAWRSDRELLWRPTAKWAPGSLVTVSVDMFGKQLGGGLVGASDLRSTFAVAGNGPGLALRAQTTTVAPSRAPAVPVRSVAPVSSPRTGALQRSSAATKPSTSARPSTPARPSTSSRSSSSGSSSSGSSSSSSRPSSSADEPLDPGYYSDEPSSSRNRSSSGERSSSDDGSTP
jgi:hypothetical protein